MKWKFPVSPVAASRPRVGKWGSYYTGTYKDFREIAKPIVNEVTQGWEPMLGPIRVSLEIYPTQPKTTKLDYPRPDIDNFAKAILDLCNGVVWGDDTQIIQLEAIKGWADADGYFTLEVEEL